MWATWNRSAARRTRPTLINDTPRQPQRAPDRGKQGMKRSSVIGGYGIPLGRVLAGANRYDSPLPAPTLDKLGDLGPLPQDITVHLDAGYDSLKTREELTTRE